MSSKQATIVLAVAMATASPVTAWAFGGLGCADLPDYARATGVLEGIPSGCDMSVEQARRIVAAHDGQAIVDQPVAPVPHARHRHRRTVPPRT